MSRKSPSVVKLERRKAAYSSLAHNFHIRLRGVNIKGSTTSSCPANLNEYDSEQQCTRKHFESTTITTSKMFKKESVRALAPPTKSTHHPLTPFPLPASRQARNPKSNPQSSAASGPKSSKPTPSSNPTSTKSSLKRNNLI